MGRRAFFPALVFVLATPVARPQSNPTQAQSAQVTSPGNSSQAAQPSAKKVWTNDDVPDLRSDAPVSSVGSANSKPSKATQNPAPATKRNAAWYRGQIANLQEKTPPLDSQIASLQAAIDGKPTGDAKKSARPYSVRQDDWSIELDQLKAKRDAIQNQIDGLRDTARRAGIPANQLP